MTNANMKPIRDIDSIYIITGASKGLGRAIAINGAKNIGRLILIARNETELQEVSKICNEMNAEAIVIPADLSSIEEIKTLKKNIQNHIPNNTSNVYLFNNASTIDPIGPIDSLCPERLNQLFSINITAAFALASEVYAIAKNKNIHSSYIINISSGVSMKAIEGWSAYCASKAALNMLSKSITTEAETFNHPIYSVSINPGALNTQMQENIRSVENMNLPITQKFKDMHTEGSLQDVDIIAKKVIQLSHSSPFPKGQFVDFNRT
tara:strand:+ start:738 stop:1532 length:795 start_codon:yes stop_codon:yes gene_type:complete